ncbi:MAG: orotidine-5'-phosphate decarboxylase [Actinomycetes bacterium]
MSQSTGAALSFGDSLTAAVLERRSQIVLGLDPDPDRLWPQAVAAASGDTPAELAASAVAAHCRAVIDAAGEHCVAVKLQLASFERLGAPGRTALSDATDFAHSAGLMVIADGKRGDIGISATSYAASLLGGSETPWGRVEGLGADAVTVNPLLGAETVEPFVEAARSAGRGLFVLVRTSNPGAADIQDRDTGGGTTVSDRLAAMVDSLGVVGPASGLADVGAVVGATAPGHLASLRRLMPKAVVLLPGVGAQGGKVEDLAPAFAPGPGGGLVTVSRGIVHAPGGSGDPAVAAAEAAAGYRSQAWSVSGG